MLLLKGGTLRQGPAAGKAGTRGARDLDIDRLANIILDALRDYPEAREALARKLGEAAAADGS